MATGPRFYMPFAYWPTPAGVPIPGALLNFYLTGSADRTPTYSNSTLTVPNANPVEANDAGVFPNIFLDPTVTYKVVLTGPDDGITDPIEYWTADPVLEAWNLAGAIYFDQPFQFLGSVGPLPSEVMGMYVAARPQRIFADFDGTSQGFAKAVGACLTPPSDADYSVFVFLNNNTVDAVGFMTVTKTTGAFVFSTVAGLAIDLDAGEFITFVAPPTSDSTLADLAWTITGINL